jgi:hypothetical protein
MSDRAAQLTALLADCTPAEVQELRQIMQKWSPEKTKAEEAAMEGRIPQATSIEEAASHIFGNYRSLMNRLAQ